MKTLLRFSVFLALGIPVLLYSQTNTTQPKNAVVDYHFYKNEDAQLNNDNFFELMRAKMLLAPESKMVLMSVSEPKNDLTHYKYQQYHNDIPIFGAVYTLHEKQGSIHRASGSYYDNLKKENSTPQLSELTAIDKARRSMNVLNFEDSKTQISLCYVDAHFPKVSKFVYLAYKIDLTSKQPYDKKRYFVDAQTGKIIGSYPLLQNEGVPSTAKTKYYGTQTITTDSVAPNQFILQDLTRGGGIFVKNWDGKEFKSVSKNWNLDNSDKDEVALDAHYCTQSYFDLMKNNFGWEGIDGKGKALNVFVHVGFAMANAAWSDDAIYLGDGDCVHSPFTSHEVIGHEFTHGMIEYSSNLIYDGESGAINESLADIFGKYLERKKDSLHFSWQIGQSFINPAAPLTRLMNNPKQLSMPAYYLGEFFDKTNDVHINSSIGNLWFTMITEGKKGTNEIDSSFNVAAIGFDKAAQIVFETNQNYLHEMSDYRAFYKYSAAVAEDLYGANSMEYKSVVEAWKAVGLLSKAPYALVDLDILSYSITACANIGDVVPFTIRIANNGLDKYIPAATDSITLRIYTNNYVFKIDSTIEGGEAIEFNTYPFWKVTDFSGLTINATLNVNDANINNNSSSIHASILKIGAPDLSIFNTTAEQFSSCFKKEVKLSFSVTNTNCSPFDEESIKVIASHNGVVLWDSSFVLSIPAAQYKYVELVAKIAEPIFDLSIESSLDTNPSNNSEMGITTKNLISTIDKPYIHDFETQSKINEYILIQTFENKPFLTIDNNSFFAASGSSAITNLLYTCAYPQNIFKSNWASYFKTLLTCVDYSKYNDTSLGFDVIQYRSDINDPYSSMLEVKWVGNETGSKVIYEEKEGDLKHFDLTLPKKFKGEVTFKIYTSIGFIEPQIDNLKTDDFILLDNIQFSTNTVATNDDLAQETITIVPNPSSDNVTIQANQPIETILLYDLNGRIIKKETPSKLSTNLDISTLNTGIYVLKINFANGNSMSKKVVKVE
jgi:Zn-dependent metalloprotease